MLLLTIIAVAAQPITVTAPVNDRDARNAAVVLDSYPRASLAAGEEGLVGFRIGLHDDGRVRSCVVIESSGYPRLDRATCDLLVSSRFKPVRDEGQRISSSHEGKIAWVLPAASRKASPPAPVQRAAAELAAEEKLCRSAQLEGSLVRERTYCLTRNEWAKMERRGRDYLVNLTSDVGGAVF